MARTRSQDAERKRRQAAQGRVVTIPACEDRDRRERLEEDCEAWLQYYFAHIFTYQFTDQQTQMIQALVRAMRHGGDQAIAASRGEGKTTLCECVLCWAVLSGIASFAVLFSATGTDAEESLSTWKDQLVDEDADRLIADYPEVCVPILALENVPNRAHFQLVQGVRHDDGEPIGPPCHDCDDGEADCKTCHGSGQLPVASRFIWSGRKVVLPKVPGSPSSGAIMATRGLDSAVRGLKVGKQRPDVAVIDDPDTDETVENPEQRKKLEKKIDRTIAGLAGQQRRLARVMLTTIQKRGTVSDRYTDPSVKSSWKGKRFRFLEKLPDRIDLWDEYVQMRSAEMEQFATGETDDEHATKSSDFYRKHRVEMDAGAKVANPHRFNDEELPDGRRIEYSAHQRYWNLVCDLGQEAVDTEYQNDPPEEAGPIESGITAYRVQTQTNGFKRKKIPPGCVALTHAMDIRKVAVHWVVRAWQQDGTGFTIDYGVKEVRGTIRGSDEGVDLAVRTAILERMEDLADDQPYTREDGEVMQPRVTLVDAGWRTEAVYMACMQWANAERLVLLPSMGYGKSSGCVRANFSLNQALTEDRKPGDGFFMTRQKNISESLWLVNLDADRWKAWEHDRWMTDLGRVGAVSLWGDPSVGGRLSKDQRHHFSYSKHVVAEVEIEELKDGQLMRYWDQKSDTNHYLDASAMCDAAARMCGVKLLRKVKPTTARPSPRPNEEKGEDARPTGRIRPGSGRMAQGGNRQRNW